MKNTSMRSHAGRAVVGSSCLLSALLLLACSQEAAPVKAVTPVVAKRAAAAAPATAVAQAPAKPAKDTVKIGACDGGEPVEVPKTLVGQALADGLMDQWKREHPEAHWVTEEKQRHAIKPPADNSDVLKGAQGKESTYGNFTQLDLATWARETEKFVAEGSRIFHDADRLGSTVAVSCDMCHPNAANTHPETYPKYQTQLGRVALLRDMIQWCVENPVRAQRLDPDGPKMRALEAYILSQRKGVAMNYGKH